MYNFNLYCSGRWFRTIMQRLKSLKNIVLILIVVEDGFVRAKLEDGRVISLRS